MTRQFDPHARLMRALVADAARHAVSPTLRTLHVRPWASATFAGARVTLVLDLAGGDPAAWLDELAEAELAVPDRLVADLAVVAATPTGATLEVLLLEA